MVWASEAILDLSRMGGYLLSDSTLDRNTCSYRTKYPFGGVNAWRGCTLTSSL
jgi:hypothetical protein